MTTRPSSVPPIPTAERWRAATTWAAAGLWATAILWNTGEHMSLAHSRGLLAWLLALLGLHPGQEALDYLNLSVRKLAHFLEYALLYLLCFRAVRLTWPARPRYLWPLALAALCAFADELLQARTTTRVGTWTDVALDTAGAAAAALLVMRRAAARPPGAS